MVNVENSWQRRKPQISALLIQPNAAATTRLVRRYRVSHWHAIAIAELAGIGRAVMR